MFLSLEVDIFTSKPAFLRTFSASAIVLFLTSGTVIKSASSEESALEDIEVNEKSEIRILIEKFVDENPEAVALLLRNWLDEDWG